MIGVVHPLHDKEVVVLSLKSAVTIQLTVDFQGDSSSLGNTFEGVEIIFSMLDI